MRLFKFFAVLLAVASMTVGGRAFAATDGLQAFRDAYFPVVNDASSYHLDISLNGPTFRANGTLGGELWRNGAVVMKGTLGWAFTDVASGRTTQKEIPVYAERSGDAVTLYGKCDGVWQRDNVFGGVTWMLDAIVTDNPAVKAQYAAAVKGVKAENEAGNRQRLQVLFDGKKLAAMHVSGSRIAALPEADQKDAREFVHYLNAALMANDPQCIWTVDKTTGKTVTVAADLTGLMRSYAQAMLQDSYQGKLTLTPEETELLSAMGYYYDLNFYLSDRGEDVQWTSVPPDVKNTAKAQEFVKDMQREFVSIVKKK